MYDFSLNQICDHILKNIIHNQCNAHQIMKVHHAQCHIQPIIKVINRFL